MEGVILRSEAMKQAGNGEPFDMVIVACDRRRGTGGELIQVKGWVKMDTKPVDEKLPRSSKSKLSRSRTKNPNHWENKTINIMNPNNTALHPIKVHFRLIQFFNGKRVING